MSESIARLYLNLSSAAIPALTPGELDSVMATERALPDDLSRQIGGRLKAARIARKLTQEQVAQRLGKTKALVSQFESGRTYPSLPVLIDLCAIYGVSIDLMLTGRSERAVLMSVLQSALGQAIPDDLVAKHLPPAPPVKKR